MPGSGSRLNSNWVVAGCRRAKTAQRRAFHLELGRGALMGGSLFELQTIQHGVSAQGRELL
jgi:hypothetical protein